LPDKTDAYTAYRRVRDLILRTELAPGAALNEADLMRRIGVGRTPLRDALHLLQHERLVEILPRKGTFVSQVTVGDLQQIFEVRNGIEDIVARAAAARANSADVRAIRELARRAASVNKPESDVSIDSEFHRRLLEIANNRYLLEMYQRLADASLRLLYLTRCGMEPPKDQADTIERAANALERRDAEALGGVLRDHVRAFRDRVSGSLFEDSPITARLTAPDWRF
jgi:DNA-binding GntR family transcriptional regulator